MSTQPTKPELTAASLVSEAQSFAREESVHVEPRLFGVTDGKAVGTYIEHKFRAYVAQRYQFDQGSSAQGIDFPKLNIDVKTTSVRQPQSSCPFKSARQKIFGLGYSLLVFVYDKLDDLELQASRLKIEHVVLVDSSRTADYQMTRGILELLKNEANLDDLIAFFHDKNLPVDDIQAQLLAAEILRTPPLQGYLTISNALQWRLQYGRVIVSAGQVDGVRRVV